MKRIRNLFRRRTGLISAVEINRQAQVFYQNTDIFIRGVDKPEVVRGLRAVFTNLGYVIVEDEK